MIKLFFTSIIILLGIVVYLSRPVDITEDHQERAELISLQPASQTASIKDTFLTPKQAKNLTVVNSARNGVDGYDVDASNVMHIGDFIDPDAEADTMISNSQVRHLGEELDPDFMDDRSALLSARHLGDDLDPDGSWYDNVATGLSQEIGDYIDADALFLDFTPQPDGVETHLGDDKDPEGYY